MKSKLSPPVKWRYGTIIIMESMSVELEDVDIEAEAEEVIDISIDIDMLSMVARVVVEEDLSLRKC